ncbi:MAG: FlgD immunoglobulin-like domain containing protein [Candidatus Latescibacterota bacterium]
MSYRDIQLLEESPGSSKRVISLAVYNVGADSAREILIRCYEGYLGDETCGPIEVPPQIGSDQWISELAPREKSEAQVVWDTAGLEGIHRISVFVDPLDQVPELNEGNNHAYRSFCLPSGELPKVETSIPFLTQAHGYEYSVALSPDIDEAWPGGRFWNFLHWDLEREFGKDLSEYFGEIQVVAAGGHVLYDDGFHFDGEPGDWIYGFCELTNRRSQGPPHFAEVQGDSGSAMIFTDYVEYTFADPLSLPLELISPADEVIREPERTFRWKGLPDADGWGVVLWDTRPCPNTFLRNVIWESGEIDGDATSVSIEPDSILLIPGETYYWALWARKVTKNDGQRASYPSYALEWAEFHLALDTTSVQNQDRRATGPIDFSLSQNTPNPFNPSATIFFSIPGSPSAPHSAERTVTLVIYSLLGQQMRTLVNGVLDRGKHSILWDGRDDSGREVSSGVYLYRLTVDGERGTETKKMVLVR